MDDSAAARLAATFRTAMKDQALNGAGVSDRIEQLTDARPTAAWISRRLGVVPRKPLLKVDPDVFLIARALEMNRTELIEAVTAAIFGVEHPEEVPA